MRLVLGRVGRAITILGRGGIKSPILASSKLFPSVTAWPDSNQTRSLTPTLLSVTDVLNLQPVRMARDRARYNQSHRETRYEKRETPFASHLGPGSRCSARKHPDIKRPRLVGERTRALGHYGSQRVWQNYPAELYNGLRNAVSWQTFCPGAPIREIRLAGATQGGGPGESANSALDRRSSDCGRGCSQW